MTDRPIPYCYWVIPGKFLAGEYPRTLDNQASIEKINALLDAGVTAFIDLTEIHELEPYTGLIAAHPNGAQVTHQRFPIIDVSTPRSAAFTNQILDAIDQQLAEGKLVYLHCWGGIGRTGTIVGCWLSRHGQSGKAALEGLRRLWQQNPKSASKTSPETIAQENYIVNWLGNR